MMTRHLQRLDALLRSGFSPDAYPIRGRTFPLAFAALIVLAAALRLSGLDRTGLWMDEAFTVAVAQLPVPTLLFGRVDNHPPLVFLIQHAWQSVVTDPALWRLPSAVTGLFGVIAVGLMVRDQAGARAGLIAAALIALSTSNVYFSQEIRMYIHVVLGAALAMWGALGHTTPGRLGPRRCAALYVIGGAIAIWSHVIGLIVMALIGFASLAAGWMAGGERLGFARAWFVRNFILLVIVLPWLVQIPSAMATFPGVNPAPVIDAPWYFRNATGFPGAGPVAILFEALLYGLALLSVPLAWRGGRRDLALLLGALIIVYPLIITALHLQTAILTNRVFLPATLAIAFGAAWSLSRLRAPRAGLALAAVLIAVSALSTANELRHRIKPEDYRGAYAFADTEGYGDAPVIVTASFPATAAWAASPGRRVYFSERGGLLRYPGPDFWKIAGNSINAFRRSSAREIDTALDGGLLVEGGLAEALAGDTQALVIVTGRNSGGKIDAALHDIGFVQVEAAHIRGRAAAEPIFHQPLTHVRLFERRTVRDGS